MPSTLPTALKDHHSFMYNFSMAPFLFEYSLELVHCEFFCEFYRHRSVEIMEILSHTFLEKFRESNGFIIEVTKELISRNIFS